MRSDLLGRTNRAFPPIWLSLRLPAHPDSLQDLVSAARDSGAPLDITTQPGVWGGLLRGPDLFFTVTGSGSYSRATDHRHAADLVEAEIIQTLSALGREDIGIYFLRAEENAEERQISGALEALEYARQEGHVRYIGLNSARSAEATRRLWQFHDAFEVLLLPRNPRSTADYNLLAPIAVERRVGIVTSHPIEWEDGVPFTALPGPWRLRNLCKSFYDQTVSQAVVAMLADRHPVMVPVDSAAAVAEALEAPLKRKPEGLDAFLQPFVDAYDDDEQWNELAASGSPHQKRATLRQRPDGM